MLYMCVFFFSSRRRHTRYWRDWSSDVCSSDLYALGIRHVGERTAGILAHELGSLEKLMEASVEELDAIPEIGLTVRSEEHTSELQSRQYLVCRLLLEKKNNCRHLSCSVTTYIS